MAPEGGDKDFGNPFIFLKYLITPGGFEGPYYQDAVIYTEQNVPVIPGQMKFSLDGTSLVNTRGKHLDIYDFDRCSGEFNFFYTIENIDDDGLYGAELS